MSPPGFADAIDGAIQPGSYCALPEPGEEPECLEPARKSYGSFFESVDAGQIDEGAASRLEADLVASPGSDDAYLALSSLAYGYLQLSNRAARSDDASPALLERLEHWNGLLGATYATEHLPSHFREALRVAADDIHSRVSGLGMSCSGAGECSSGLLLTLEEVDRGGPIRGPLRGLIDRMRGTEE